LVALPDLGPLAFVKAHQSIALALAGDHAGLERLADDLKAQSECAEAPDMSRMARAFSALAAADAEAAAAHLEALAPSFNSFGGSYAQGEIFEDSLIAALASSGRTADAVAQLERRLARRASPRDERWIASLS